MSAAISTTPASAVPIEAPRFVSVFCRPPTSPLCSSGTADTVTAPSCDASAPMPSPARSIGTVTISGARTRVERRPSGRRCRRAATRKPNCTTRRGDASGKSCGIADGRDQQRDRQREQADAGRHRREPERDRQEQRDHEEQPGLQQELEEERRQPAAAAAGSRASSGRPAARRPRATSAALPARRTRQTTKPPGEHQPDRRREAEPRRPVGLRLHPAPRSGRAGRRTRRAPGRAPTAAVPTRSRCGCSAGGASAMRRGEQQDARPR